MRRLKRIGLVVVTVISLAMISMALQAPYEVTRGEQSQETINALFDRRLNALEDVVPIVMSMNDKLNFLLGSLGVVGLGGAGFGIRKRQLRKNEESQ